MDELLRDLEELDSVWSGQERETIGLLESLIAVLQEEGEGESTGALRAN